MLAADVLSPWQNPLNRYDVNVDGRVSPSDLLAIINDLNRNGTHTLEDSANPLAAGGSPVKFLDVNGDGRVSPMDMLNVINELADPPLMTVSVFPTDMAGTPITSIPVGGQYRLETVVQDVRDSPQFGGVFSAGVDISYDTLLSSHDSGQTAAFDPFWNLSSATYADLSTQGRIIGYGATQNGTPPGTAPKILFSVMMTADNPGTQTFTAAFDSNLNDEYGLYGMDAAVTSDQIDFTGSTLQITSDVTISIGDVSALETNADTTFNFTVSLSSPQANDVTVDFTTNDGTATMANNDYAPTSGTVTFAAGATAAVIPVTVHGDTNVEPDETFSVSLSNPNPVFSFIKATGVGTILNDDALSDLSITGDTVTNVTSDTTTAHFTVSVAQPVTAPVTVVYATADDSAIAGVDYQATSGTLTFNPGGSQTQMVPVTIIGDANPDSVSDFFVNLSNPSSNAELVNDQATIVINPAVAQVTFGIDNVAKFEGDPGQTTAFVFTISLSAAAPQPVVLTYATADGSATTAGNDYVATSGTLTFNPGDPISQQVTVQVTGDTNVEPSETFLVNVAGDSGTSGTAQGVGTIVDDDGAPSLTISDVTVNAGANVTMAVFTVTLAGKLTQNATVAYASSDNTALAGVDYLAVSGNLLFVPGGAATQTISVIIASSSSPADDKTFFVSLSSPTGGVTIQDELGVGTIITQGISISNASVVEGNSPDETPMVFTVSLSRTLNQSVTVVYSTADGTATAGSDYTPTSGTLTFSGSTQSQLVTVMIKGDDVQEGNETFSVKLSDATGAPIFTPSGTGTILDDDGYQVSYVLQLTDLSGTPLPTDATLNVGDDFLLQVYVTDVEVDPTGVAQAFLDVMYQSTLVEPMGSPTFGPFLKMFPTGRFETGLLDDFGAFGQTTQPDDPSATQLLFSQSFKAIDVGLLNFTGTVATDALDPGHETYVYLSENSDPVPVDQITLQNPNPINIGSNVLTVSDAQATEGSDLVFTVTRFLPTTETATVVYQSVNGTAIAGQDYTAVSGTLTFVPGESDTQTITVHTTNDTINEPDETFSIQLSNPVGASISGLPIGTGTIVDNDGVPSISVSNASALEGANAVFTVSLSSPSGKQITVVYATGTSGTATSGSDYTPVSGTLTFNPGTTQQTVTVATLSDTLLEPSESFQLKLSNPTNATLSTTTGNGTILDVPPAGISGYVYVDLNNNGIKDANETGIAGAIVTATKTSDGTSIPATTDANGQYSFIGLIPGTYTVTETQPGFYTDGRDTRFGVDSAYNDKFVGIALAPSAGETGFNFGEQGIRSDFISAFINRRALFATSTVGGTFGPNVNMPGTVLDLRTGDIWVSFDGGWEGLREVDALFNSSQGPVTMTLYNNALQQVAVSAPTSTGSVLIYGGQLGAAYFLKLSGTNSHVTVQVSQPACPATFWHPLATAPRTTRRLRQAIRRRGPPRPTRPRRIGGSPPARSWPMTTANRWSAAIRRTMRSPMTKKTGWSARC